MNTKHHPFVAQVIADDKARLEAVIKQQEADEAERKRRDDAEIEAVKPLVIALFPSEIHEFITLEVGNNYGELKATVHLPNTFPVTTTVKQDARSGKYVTGKFYLAPTRSNRSWESFNDLEETILYAAKSWEAEEEYRLASQAEDEAMTKRLKADEAAKIQLKMTLDALTPRDRALHEALRGNNKSAIAFALIGLCDLFNTLAENDAKKEAK